MRYPFQIPSDGLQHHVYLPFSARGVHVINQSTVYLNVYDSLGMAVGTFPPNCPTDAPLNGQSFICQTQFSGTGVISLEFDSQYVNPGGAPSPGSIQPIIFQGTTFQPIFSGGSQITIPQTYGLNATVLIYNPNALAVQADVGGIEGSTQFLISHVDLAAVGTNGSSESFGLGHFANNHLPSILCFGGNGSNQIIWIVKVFK